MGITIDNSQIREEASLSDAQIRSALASIQRDFDIIEEKFNKIFKNFDLLNDKLDKLGTTFEEGFKEIKRKTDDIKATIGGLYFI